MKKFAFITFLIIGIFNLKLSAQESIVGDINYGQLEKYIQSARENYPRKKIFEANVEKAKTGVPIANMSYFDILNASYIYRPDDKAALNPLNPYTVNGFQFGVNLNVGAFLQKPFVVKKAKAEYKVAQLENQEYDMILANEVKRRYYEYLQQQGTLKIKTQAAQDNKSVAENLKYKFAKGEVTIDVFNQSRINSATADSDKLMTEVAYFRAKDALEEIIGKKLTEIK